MSVLVVGELDVATAPYLESLADVLANVGLRAVELDLRGVPFLDLHGLRALEAVRRRLRNAAVDVREVGASPAVTRLRALLGLAADEPSVAAA